MTSPRRATRIRECPRDARSAASASPMPEEAPVTTARAVVVGVGRLTISQRSRSDLRGQSCALFDGTLGVEFSSDIRAADDVGHHTRDG